MDYWTESALNWRSNLVNLALYSLAEKMPKDGEVVFYYNTTSRDINFEYAIAELFWEEYDETGPTGIFMGYLGEEEITGVYDDDGTELKYKLLCQLGEVVFNPSVHKDVYWISVSDLEQSFGYNYG